MTPAYWSALAGGLLIGLSAATLLLFNGRVAGVSGIVGRLAKGADLPANAAFVIGLVVGPLFYPVIFDRWPAVTMTTATPAVLLAGLLVGFGTRMGSGCTSGHGVVGLARGSRRSAAAVATFLVTGVLTVATMQVMAW